MEVKKPTITLYQVHADTDYGYTLETFQSEAAREEYCAKLMREKGGEEVKQLLDDGDADEAWMTFEEEASMDQEYYALHETVVELPMPYAAAPELLAALARMRGEFLSHICFNVNGGNADVFHICLEQALAAIAKAGGVK
jgi:hypothetical protein